MPLDLEREKTGKTRWTESWRLRGPMMVLK